jgi:hypothetical protein
MRRLTCRFLKVALDRAASILIRYVENIGDYHPKNPDARYRVSTKITLKPNIRRRASIFGWDIYLPKYPGAGKGDEEQNEYGRSPSAFMLINPAHPSLL